MDQVQDSAITRQLEYNSKGNGRSLNRAGIQGRKPKRPEGNYASIFIALMESTNFVRRSTGAGSGNRTRVFSLEGCCSTIELHPHRDPKSGMAPPMSSERRWRRPVMRTWRSVAANADLAFFRRVESRCRHCPARGQFRVTIRSDGRSACCWGWACCWASTRLVAAARLASARLAASERTRTCFIYSHSLKEERFSHVRRSFHTSHLGGEPPPSAGSRQRNLNSVRATSREGW